MSVIMPSWLVPREESHEWVDELSTVFQPEFAPGASQRQSYGGCRLRINRSHTVRGEELAVLESTLLAADGRFETVYARGPQRFNTGSLPVSELLTNSTFNSGTTGFTASTGEIVLSNVARALRVRRTSILGVADVMLSPVTILASPQAYVFRFFIRQGKGNININLRFGTTAGAADLGIAAWTSTITQPGFYEVPVIVASTVLHISIRDNIVGRLVDDYYDLAYVSLARSLLVSGSSQTGSDLLVANGPISTDGVLIPGDWISTGQTVMGVLSYAGCELKQVTQGLTLNSGTIGSLYLKPSLFRSPDANSAVVCYQPFGKFLVSDLKIKNRLGVEADVSYTLEQVYD